VINDLNILNQDELNWKGMASFVKQLYSQALGSWKLTPWLTPIKQTKTLWMRNA